MAEQDEQLPAAVREAIADVRGYADRTIEAIEAGRFEDTWISAAQSALGRLDIAVRDVLDRLPDSRRREHVGLS